MILIFIFIFQYLITAALAELNQAILSIPFPHPNETEPLSDGSDVYHVNIDPKSTEVGAVNFRVEYELILILQAPQRLMLMRNALGDPTKFDSKERMTQYMDIECLGLGSDGYLVLLNKKDVNKDIYCLQVVSVKPSLRQADFETREHGEMMVKLPFTNDVLRPI
jgi:hypothetical protein